MIGVLEKDWFEPSWCDLFTHHWRVQHGNHLFHVTSDLQGFSLAHAEKMVASVARGEFSTIDLKELSVIDLIAKRRSGKTQK